MTAQYDPITVDVWRGPSVESRHQVVASVVDERGAEVARYGDAGFSTYWRSSAKPFQARPWVDDGTVDHFGWGDEQIAMMSASHVGAPLHVELVRGMLADIGLSEDDLLADRDLKARQNCSGNHTGMLAACVRHGWDVATYQHADHPAQVAGVESAAEAAGIAGVRDALRRGRVRHRRVRHSDHRRCARVCAAAAPGAAHRSRDVGAPGADRGRW